jgi:uncharacterized membrane protein YqaE (UPF0057 family)
MFVMRIKNIGWLVVVLLMGMASCSVDKRVHRKGYHVEWYGHSKANKDFAKQDGPAEETVADVPVSSQVEEVQSAPVSTVSQDESAPMAQSNVQVQSDEATAPAKKTKEQKASVKRQASVQWSQGTKWSAKHPSPQDWSADGRDQRETDLLICVLVAIFIAPLGVYLFYEELNRDFWITLILYCVVPWLGGFLYAMYVLLIR